jgi:hypothetical protein
MSTVAPTLADREHKLAQVEAGLGPARRSAAALAKGSPQAAAISRDAVVRLDARRVHLIADIALLKATVS